MRDFFVAGHCGPTHVVDVFNMTHTLVIIPSSWSVPEQPPGLSVNAREYNCPRGVLSPFSPVSEHKDVKRHLAQLRVQLRITQSPAWPRM